MLQAQQAQHHSSRRTAASTVPNVKVSAPFQGACRASQPPAAAASALARGSSSGGPHHGACRRDTMLLLTSTIASLSLSKPALAAFTPPPPGYRAHVDRLDGYTFNYPEDWATVTSSGNDIFLRNPFNIDENLFVDISSPSSSRYRSVEDLGSPEDAAQRLLDQYLKQEFMSTRLGVRREGQVMGASNRQAPDGRLYYDLDIRMTSYASRNPYVATQAEVMSQYGVEWDRRLLTTLGVANNRLYQLRLQTSNGAFESAQPLLQTIRQSFRVKEVEA